MKKLFALLALFAFLFSFVACDMQGEATLYPADQIEADAYGADAVAPTAETERTGEPLGVIATIFPQYDFLRQIGGSRIDLSMLISPGAESHAFEPTPRDIVAINNADLLVYVGGHGDTWVEAIVDSLGEELRTAALVDMVDAVYAEHRHHGDYCEDDDHGHHHDHGHPHSHDHDHSHDHGHSHAHDHDHSHDHGHSHAHDHDHSHDHGHSHSHDHDHHHEHEHEHSHSHDHDHSHDHGHSHDHHHDHSHGHHHHHDPHLDEHVWTCPRNAARIVRALTEILAEEDEANAEYFRANAATLIAELEALDRDFLELIADPARRNTIVIADRFPFRYLMDTYGIEYYAAFYGCTAETTVSPATIARLINTVNDNEIPVVFHIEFSDMRIANTIAEATGATVLELHSAHNVSSADLAAGITYVEIMRRNLDALREALS